jgi:hypothetical protein
VDKFQEETIFIDVIAFRARGRKLKSSKGMNNRTKERGKT